MFEKIIEKKQVQRYGKLNDVIDSSKYEEFVDGKKASDWGKELYSDWAATYSKNIRILKEVFPKSSCIDSISCYCGYMYKGMNEFLRDRKDSEANLYREMAHIMALEMCNAPRIDKNLVVYRCVDSKVIDDLIVQNKNGSAYQEEGFLSTSLLKKTITSNPEFNSFENVLKIYVEKNEIAIFADVLNNRNEKEMIFLPKCFIRLIKYPYKDTEIEKMVYECKLINWNKLLEL